MKRLKLKRAMQKIRSICQLSLCWLDGRSVLLDAMRAILGVHCHWSKFWDRQRNRSSGEKLSCLFQEISHLQCLSSECFSWRERKGKWLWLAGFPLRSNVRGFHSSLGIWRSVKKNDKKLYWTRGTNMFTAGASFGIDSSLIIFFIILTIASYVICVILNWMIFFPQTLWFGKLSIYQRFCYSIQ